MSYQVLARKLRPSNFETLVGQEHVLKPLVHALDNERLHHAYLFTGIQGIGKTSIARILAKCLNCETGVTSKPCGKCSACQAIDAGKFVDLIEVDAASRTKVEDTRELLDNVLYAPTCGRFKIYLIDEVHMLSGHSFNALLKTLEEPPAHVKFLLATTDPQKLPVTVLSRCLQFHLKKLSTERIADYLELTLANEKIQFEKEAVYQIARAAQGSMRDSLSLLDQAIAFSQGNINEKDISQMLGTIEHSHVVNILKALATKEGKTLLTISKQLSAQGADFSNALESLISTLHKIATLQVVPEAAEGAHPADQKLLELSQLLSKEDIQLFYQIALTGRRDLPLASDYKTGFEMTLLRMLAFAPLTEEAVPHVAIPKTNTQTVKAPPTIEKPATPVTHSAQFAIGNWADFLDKLHLDGMDYALASNCELSSIEDNSLTLALSASHSALMNNKTKDRLKETINKHFGKPIELIINIAQTPLKTPAKQAQDHADEQHRSAIKAIEADENVQDLVNKLGVVVDPSLVKSTE